MEILTAYSTYPKGGVSFIKDSFMVKQSLVFQIMFCGKSPALRVAAKHQIIHLIIWNTKHHLTLLQKD